MVQTDFIEELVVTTLSCVLLSLPCAGQSSCPGPFTGTTVLISATPSGGVPQFGSGNPDIDANGRFLVFSNASSDLLPGDTNGLTDIYVADVAAHSLHRISQNSSGVIGNGTCGEPRMSADGERVVYWSTSVNLVDVDLNGRVDIFLSEWRQGVTRIASLGVGGVQGNGNSTHGTISSCGRWIAFDSLADNLVPGDTNGAGDVFVRDDLLGTTERVNLTWNGNQSTGNASTAVISGNGRFVAFSTTAFDIVPGDTNGFHDTFIRDRQLGITTLVSRSMQGTTANGISGPVQFDDSGSLLLFGSDANDLVPGDTGGFHDVFLFTSATQSIRRISLTHDGLSPNDESFLPCISRDGRFVGFATEATNVVPGDTNQEADGFLLDLLTGTLTRPTVNSAGCEGNGATRFARMSDDARFLAVHSVADNMSPEGNPQHRSNIYLRDQAAPGPHVYCMPTANSKDCVALISALGVPSASTPSGFTIGVTEFTAGQPAIFFYGTQGPAVLPFGPAIMCVQPPLRRTPPLASTGSPSIACDGAASFDFNAWRSQGSNPLLTAGTTVWGQFWIRDPNGPGPRIGSASDAVVFTLTP